MMRQKPKIILRSPTMHAEAVRLTAGLVQFLALARVLSVRDYGRLALLYFAAALLAPLVNASATTVNVRRATAGAAYISLLRAVLVASAWGLALSLVLGCGIGALGLWPGGTWAALGVLLSEACGGTLLQGLASIRQGRMEFDAYRNWLTLAAAARIAAVGVFVCVAPHTLTGWAITVSAVLLPVAAFGYWISSRASGEITDEQRPSQGAADVSRAEASVFALNALTLRLYDDADKAIIGAFDSYTAVGLYSVAYRIASYILFPSRAVMSAVMPEIFREGSASVPEWAEVLGRARRELFGTLALAAPVLATAALLAPLALGSRYSASAPMALALIPCLALRGFHWIYGDVLVAVGRIRTRLYGQIASFTLPMAAYLGLIPLMGAWGAVVATGLGEGMAIVVMRETAYRQMRTKLAGSGELRRGPDPNRGGVTLV